MFSGKAAEGPKVGVQVIGVFRAVKTSFIKTIFVVHEVHQGEGGAGRRTHAGTLQYGPTQRLGGNAGTVGSRRAFVRVLGRHPRAFKSQQGGANLQHSPEGVLDTRTNPDPLEENSNLAVRNHQAATHWRRMLNGMIPMPSCGRETVRCLQTSRV